jgi:two-component system, LytTR family, response regulator
MNKYKAIIIDDEPMARELLQGMILEYTPTIEIVALCENLPEGVKAINRFHPDIVFLDIEMPGYSGLDLLDFFNNDEINFSIIFVTAYNQYAIQAFKLSAVDYLLKPIESDDLIQSLSLFEKKLTNNNVQVLKHNLSSLAKKIAINTANIIVFVNVDDILFFKADGAYTHVVLNDDRDILTSKNLKYFEEVLSGNPKFYRCHKSFIVNIHFISEYVKSDGGYLKVKGHNVALSVDKTATILDKMKLS